MKSTTSIARIYVGTYAKYNSGSIAGKWLDLEDCSSREEFLTACAEVHKDEKDPEFMFQDFEGFPESYYSESHIPDELFEFLALDDDERQVVAMYAECSGLSFRDFTPEDARDAFHGKADSVAEFAERLAEECGEIPKDLPSWIVIDWDASWNCNLRHDFRTPKRDENGDLWFFLNH